MDKRDELLGLAAKCEAASGPDRELDVRISLLISGVVYAESDVADLLRVRDEPTGYGRYRPADEYVPAYTASLDAALTLVPEGAPWKVEDHPVYGIAAVADCEQGWGSTPALALCAACLRARAASQNRSTTDGE